MKKILLGVTLCGLLYGQTPILLSQNQAQTLGIDVEAIDNSGYSLIGPFIANIDFSNQSAFKQISPFEITITNIYKKEGEFVKKGDVICEVSGDLVSNLIYEYQNTMAKYEVALNNAKKDKELYDAGVISQREYQQSYLLVNELELRFKDLKNVINQAGLSIKSNGFSYPVLAQSSGILALAPKKISEKIQALSPYIIIAKDNAMLGDIKLPYDTQITKDSDIYLLDSKQKIGKIESISITIDKASNSLLARASILSPLLKSGENIFVLIRIKNPPDTFFIKRENITKFNQDYLVFVQTKEGFMPTKINIIKEVYNGYLVAKESLESKDKLANGALIVLKGMMSDLGFE